MQRTLHFIFFLFLLLWSFVLVQSKLPVIKSAPLSGAFSPKKDTTLTWQTWWDASFQKKKNDYLNDHVGFHSDFVRINNQLDYSLFGKNHARGVLIGKSGYLFEKGYVNAYCGRDFKGSEIMERKMKKLAEIRDSLAKRNIPMVFVFMPNKARTYHEFLPDSLQQLPFVDSSNYEVCKTLLKKYNIPHIDMLQWFVELRKTAAYPLFKEYGVHWSRYGVAVAADSLCRYLRQQGLYIPPFSYQMELNQSQQSIMQSSDYDLGLGFNLILPLPLNEHYYPRFSYVQDSSKQRIKPVFLSDSFYWMWIYEGLSDNLFGNNWEFWNYGHEIWRPGQSTVRHEITTAYPKLYDKSAFIFFSTEGNLSNFGFGLMGW